MRWNLSGDLLSSQKGWVAEPLFFLVTCYLCCVSQEKTDNQLQRGIGENES